MTEFNVTGLHFPSGTDPSEYGCNGSIEIVYAHELWLPGEDRSEVNAAQITQGLLSRFDASYNGKIVLNIEHWEVGLSATDAERSENILRIAHALEVARDSLPNAEFGLYGILPVRDYWTYILDNEVLKDALDRVHDQLSVLADYVDFVSPSLYTFYDDPEGWLVYADANLTNAEKFGLPVYPFIWPEYHNSNAELGFTEIPKADFLAQLTYLAGRVDGVVVWSYPLHMTQSWLEGFGPEIAAIVSEVNSKDWLVGGEGDDVLDGGWGNDFLSGRRGSDTLHGGNGDDTIRGGNGDDLLQGEDGADTMRGGSGRDVGYAGEGNDDVRGGCGRDRLLGQAGDDHLFGGNGADRLLGNSGDDYIVGGKGKDVLNGGAGQDVLAGGAGQDTFIFFGGHSGLDRIVDFDPVRDRLIFSFEASQEDIEISLGDSGLVLTLGDQSVLLSGLTVGDAKYLDIDFF